ncbi:hypothetical protein Lal_00045014 [Lupinus albus]|nr:hypothetical protein Lal_00045014 [Lupinus albus]
MHALKRGRKCGIGLECLGGRCGTGLECLGGKTGALSRSAGSGHIQPTPKVDSRGHKPSPYLRYIDFAELNKDCVSTIGDGSHRHKDFLFKENRLCVPKSSKGKPQGLYTPLPIPEPPWINISMDFEVTLPRIKNDKVLERISNNAYKINIPSDYGNVNASFNVADISPFETGNEDLDSRSNSVQEGGDYSNPPKAINLDDLMGLRGPITRVRAKKVQSTLGQHVLSLQTSLGPNNHMRPINCLLIEDEPFEGHS